MGRATAAWAVDFWENAGYPEFLLSVLLALGVLGTIGATLAALPLWSLADIVLSETMGRAKRILWAAVAVLAWPLGPALYGVAGTRSRALRAATLVVVLANLGIVWTGHRNARRESGGVEPSLEHYAPIRRRELLELRSVFGSYGSPGNDDYVHALALSNDASRVVVSGGRSLVLWDLQARERLRTYEELPANDVLAGWLHGRWLGRGDAVALSPDGRTVAVYEGSRTMRLGLTLPSFVRDVFDGRDRGIVRLFGEDDEAMIRAHRSNVTALRFLGSGERLATSSFDRTIAVWDVLSGARVLELGPDRGWITTAAISPDGALIVTAGHDPSRGESHFVTLWDLRTGDKLQELRGHDDQAIAVGFDSTGRRAITASFDDTFRFWDVSNGLELRRLDAERLSHVIISESGRYALVGNESVALWDLEAGAVVDELDFRTCDDRAAAGAFGPNDGFVLIGTSRGAVLRFDFPR